MPKTIIKVINAKGGFEKNIWVKMNLPRFKNQIVLRRKKNGIIKIEHDFEGKTNFLVGDNQINNITLPGVFILDQGEQTLSKLYEFSEYQFKINLDYKFRNEFSSTSEEIYKFLTKRYKDQFVIHDIEQEGSIKKKIIIYSSLIYMGIANYGSFRAGLREINNDLKEIGQNIESIIDFNQMEISEKNTKLVYPKMLSDEIENYYDLRNNFNSPTDEQQTVKRIQELTSITEGKDRDYISAELEAMGIPLETPYRDREKQNIINKQYGIIREQENEKIKTDTNIV